MVISVSKLLRSRPGATSTFWSPSSQEQWPRSPSHSLVLCFRRDSPWMLRNLASRNCRPQPATVFHVVPGRTIVWSPVISEAHCLAGYLWKQCSQRTVQDEEALAEPDLASTLPVRASYEKTRVKYSKGRRRPVACCASVSENEIFEDTLVQQVQFCGILLSSIYQAVFFFFFLFLVSAWSFEMAKTWKTNLHNRLDIFYNISNIYFIIYNIYII